MFLQFSCNYTLAGLDTAQFNSILPQLSWLVRNVFNLMYANLTLIGEIARLFTIDIRFKRKIFNSKYRAFKLVISKTNKTKNEFQKIQTQVSFFLNKSPSKRSFVQASEIHNIQSTIKST